MFLLIILIEYTGVQGHSTQKLKRQYQGIDFHESASHNV